MLVRPLGRLRLLRKLLTLLRILLHDLLLRITIFAGAVCGRLITSLVLLPALILPLRLLIVPGLRLRLPLKRLLRIALTCLLRVSVLRGIPPLLLSLVLTISSSTPSCVATCLLLLRSIFGRSLPPTAAVRVRRIIRILRISLRTLTLLSLTLCVRNTSGLR